MGMMGTVGRARSFFKTSGTVKARRGRGPVFYQDILGLERAARPNFASPGGVDVQRGRRVRPGWVHLVDILQGPTRPQKPDFFFRPSVPPTSPFVSQGFCRHEEAGWENQGHAWSTESRQVPRGGDFSGRFFVNDPKRAVMDRIELRSRQGEGGHHSRPPSGGGWAGMIASAAAGRTFAPGNRLLMGRIKMFLLFEHDSFSETRLSTFPDHALENAALSVDGSNRFSMLWPASGRRRGVALTNARCAGRRSR